MVMYALLVFGALVGLAKCMDTPVAKIGASAAGDPHYCTYDGAEVNFQGGCKYLLSGTDPRYAKELGEKQWTVQVQNRHFVDNQTHELVAFTTVVHIECFKHVISIREHFKVMVDDQRLYEGLDLLHGIVVGMHENQIFIKCEQVGGEIVAIEATVPKLNFQVRYDGRGQGGRHWCLVNLLSYRKDLKDILDLQGHMIGILGNFNGDPEDDLIPKGRSEKGSEVEIGQSWQLDTDICGF